MPEIAAFRGLRYNPSRFHGLFDRLIAPPYAVLSEEDKAALLAKHELNIVAVDLPHVPPKNAGPAEAYAMAASTLQQWRQDQTLIFEDQPAIYVYHQQYSHGGKQYIRRKFFARLRLEEFGKGGVFPHEQTFGGPKADRLKLMEATSCQLSAVFGLYSDPDNTISTLLDPGSRVPDMTATMDGVTNRMWVVKDPSIVKAVAARMARRPVFIADGHHRYGTALNYRDALIARGNLPMDHAARFTLVGLCAMEDPGAVILPTHRVISDFKGIDAGTVFDSLREGIELRSVTVNLKDPDNILPPHSNDDVCVYVHQTQQCYTGTFSQRVKLSSLAPDKSAAWCQLDVAYLHRYLIDELVTSRLLGGTPPSIMYFKAVNQALDAAREENGIALICKSCTMNQLRAVSEAGDLMPQKSTFFYPKLATGMVVNPLA